MKFIQKNPKDIVEVLEYLFHLGFGIDKVAESEIKNLDANANISKEMIRHYQEFHGDLDAHGQVDGATEIHISRPRCGCPDIMPAGRSKWDESCQQNITTKFDLPGRDGMTTQDIELIWLRACRAWELVSNIRMPYKPSERDVRITAAWDRMSRGVLGESYLPNGDCSDTMTQRYNQSVTWRPKLLYPTIVHELGHALGLSHQPRGNIMYYAITDQQKLGPQDIAQIILRYGKATVTPPEPRPPVPVPPSGEQTLVVKGRDLTYEFINGGDSGGHDFG